MSVYRRQSFPVITSVIDNFFTIYYNVFDVLNFGKRVQEGFMKYDISDEFGFFKKFTPPFNDFIVNFWAGLINKSYKALYKENISVKKLDAGDFCIYLAKPCGLENLPCIVYFHGGAFVFPAYKSHYKTCALYVKQSKVAVAFVDYRLAPKHPFPCGEKDCKAALDYVFDHSEQLSVDKNKIGIMGDSAGGNLAAKVSAYAAEKGYPLACQLYLYPVIDPSIDTESKRRFTDTPMWNSVLNEKMWKYYFNGNDPYSCGYEDILSEGFSGSTAPAYVETCEYDCLKDEGILFYESLVKKGIDAQSFTVKNAMHGFEIKDCPITRDAVKRRMDFFTEAFKNLK